VRVASGTADFETGQIPIIKRSRCPTAFCNYKFINVCLFQNSAVFYTHTYAIKRNKILHADGNLSLHSSVQTGFLAVA
jgi:hypothetical protein